MTTIGQVLFGVATLIAIAAAGMVTIGFLVDVARLGGAGP
jgi:hypothetical protein